MSATYNWSGTYGSAPGTTADLGTSGNLWNYKTLDSLTGVADYTSNKITAGNNSYEVWIRGHWTGTFNTIDNLQYWISTGGADTGVDLKWDGETTAYVTPTTATSTIATADAPTADPGTANVSIDGALTGELTAAGFSSYMVSQLQTTTAAAPGDITTITHNLSYDES